MSSAQIIDYFAIFKERVQVISNERQKDYMPFCHALIKAMHGSPCRSLIELKNWIAAWDQIVHKVESIDPSFKSKGKQIVLRSALQEVYKQYSNIATTTTTTNIPLSSSSSVVPSSKKKVAEQKYETKEGKKVKKRKQTWAVAFRAYV